MSGQGTREKFPTPQYQQPLTVGIQLRGLGGNR